MTTRPIDAIALRCAAETCRETTDAFLELIDNAPTLEPGDRPEACWERFKLEGSNTPFWRCSHCRDCCYPAPDGLERVFYCPKCGAHTGGNVLK